MLCTVCKHQESIPSCDFAELAPDTKSKFLKRSYYIDISHRIHAWYTYLLIYHKNQPLMNVDKSIVPMDWILRVCYMQIYVYIDTSSHPLCMRFTSTKHDDMLVDFFFWDRLTTLASFKTCTANSMAFNQALQKHLFMPSKFKKHQVLRL